MIKKWQNQLSHHYAIVLHIAIVHDYIFCNEMIYTVLCINSQPLSHVINVYIEAQMMILNKMQI